MSSPPTLSGSPSREAAFLPHVLVLLLTSGRGVLVFKYLSAQGTGRVQCCCLWAVWVENRAGALSGGKDVQWTPKGTVVVSIRKNKETHRETDRQTHPTCVHVPVEARRGHYIPWAGITGGHEPPDTVLGTELRVSEKQQALLTTEPSLQPLQMLRSNEQNITKILIL